MPALHILFYSWFIAFLGLVTSIISTYTICLVPAAKYKLRKCRTVPTIQRRRPRIHIPSSPRTIKRPSFRARNIVADDSPLKGKGKSVGGFKLKSPFIDRRVNISSLNNSVVSSMLKPRRRFKLSYGATFDITRPSEIRNMPMLEGDGREILPSDTPVPSKAQALLGVRPAKRHADSNAS